MCCTTACISCFDNCQIAQILGQWSRKPQTCRICSRNISKNTQEAWSGEKIRPKWHYGLHLEKQIRQCGMLLGTFMLERKHIFSNNWLLETGALHHALPNQCCWNSPQQICKKAPYLIGRTQRCWAPPKFDIFLVPVVHVKQAQAWSWKAWNI